jgi:hypothetical protein
MPMLLLLLLLLLLLHRSQFSLLLVLGCRASDRWQHTLDKFFLPMVGNVVLPFDGAASHGVTLSF